MTRPPVLSVAGLSTGYGRKQVVHDLDLHVGEGEVVALFGHNGSGKTTTIRAVLGLLPALSGRVEYLGRDVTRASTRSRVNAGLAMIPSEHFVFPDLSIHDNLLLGASNAPKGSDRSERFALVHGLFPLLADRGSQIAGQLSGGQQRMVSLGMALMAQPRLLLLDEPSLGLAPSVVEQIFSAVRTLVDQGEVSVLLLEQNVAQSLRIADRVYVVRSGALLLEETATQMQAREHYWDLF